MKFLSEKKNLYFTGMYVSLFVFMICSAANWGMGVALFKILAILCFGLFLFKENSKDNEADFEKSVMVLVVLLFNIFMLQRGKMQGHYEILNIACGCILIMTGLMYFVFHHNGIPIKKWFSENKTILLFILCFVLLSVKVIDYFFIWDALQYYDSLMIMIDNFNADFSGIYNLYLCTHVSLGYTLWVMLSQLFYEGTVSIQIADIVLAGISIYAYYQILRKLLREKYSDTILALATVPYAFSPFVMGLVGNMNLDSATMYFAVIFFACLLWNYEYLGWIFAFFFCFTKEPAVIYYVVFVIAKVICDYFAENRFHLWKLAKFGFGNIKNYIFAFPAVLWIVLNKINQVGGWNQDSARLWDNNGWNCFGFNSHDVSIELKQVFFLNFNWLFWLTILLGIIILCIKRVKIKRSIYKILVPIGIMGISVIVFACVYITYTLPRYIVPIIPSLYLIATVIVGNSKSNFFKTWNILMAILLLIQSFQSVDPVENKIFPLLVTGNQKNDVLYQPDVDVFFSDQHTYNRQNLYWSDTIRKLLDDAKYDGSMLIVYPDSMRNARYGLIGSEGYLWNTHTGNMEYYNKAREIPEGCVWIKSCYVREAKDIWESGDYNSILYITPRWITMDESFILEDERFTKEILKQGEIYNKGFYIQYVVLDMKYKAPLGKGNYIVSPKQNSSLGLGTDGQWIWLKEEGDKIAVTYEKTRYKFNFIDYYVLMDVRHNYVDENGTVWTYEENGSNAQKFRLEKIEDYYMICWEDYALTYNLDDNSVRLTPITGDENQLWSFSR